MHTATAPRVRCLFFIEMRFAAAAGNAPAWTPSARTCFRDRCADFHTQRHNW